MGWQPPITPGTTFLEADLDRFTPELSVLAPRFGPLVTSTVRAERERERDLQLFHSHRADAAMPCDVYLTICPTN